MLRFAYLMPVEIKKCGENTLKKEKRIDWRLWTICEEV